MTVRRAVGSLVALSLLLAPSSARAGSFLDPDAGLFTLVRPDPRLEARGQRALGRLRALPDGGALFVVVRTGRLWRMSPDGRTEPLRWAGAVGSVAVEPAGTVLVARPGKTKLLRLDLRARRRTTVKDLADAPGYRRRRGLGITALAALDDGSTAAAIGSDLWRIAPRGALRRISYNRFVVAMAALRGGAFGILTGNGDVSRVEADGTNHHLASGASDALAAGPADTLVTTTDPASPALTSLAMDGGAERYPWDSAGVLGAAEGLPLRRLRWQGVTSMVVAVDGTLLFTTMGNRLRAVVPSGSRRARVAITQASFDSFRTGRVHYFAGAPGRLELEIRRGERTVQRVVTSTAGGEGEVGFQPPGPGAYDLRLRLATPSALTEGHAHVDIRSLLPIREGSNAISAQRTDTAGDEGGAVGTEVGRCGRIAARIVECVVMAVEYGSNFDDDLPQYSGTKAPTALARGALRNDGAVLTEIRPIEATRRAPGLTFTVPERQRFGGDGLIAARIAAVDAGRASVSAVVRATGVERGFVISAAARQLKAGGAWGVVLQVPAQKARTIRRWLGQRRKVTARVEATLSVDAGVAPATSTRGVESRLVR